MMRTLLILAFLCGQLTAQEFNTAANDFDTGLHVPGQVKEGDRIVVSTRTVTGELDISRAYHGFNTGDTVDLHITKTGGTSRSPKRTSEEWKTIPHEYEGSVDAGDQCTLCWELDTDPIHRSGQRAAQAPPRVAPAARYAAPAVQYVKRTQCNGRGQCTTVWVPVSAPAQQAPVKQVPARQAPQPGMHSHKCASCGYEWWHYPGGSHTCANCGRGGNYAKHRTSYGAAATTTAAGSGRGLRGLLPRNWGK